jgi:KUP system potassium uptake protein
VVHQTVILRTIRTEETARWIDRPRVEVRDLGSGVYRFWVSFGFMEDPNLPAALVAMTPPPGVDLSNPSYFLSRETLIAKTLPPLSPWRAKLFAAMLRNASDASQFFRLPADRVVELGMQITN